MDKQQIDHMVSDKAKAAKSGMRTLSLVSSEVRNSALQAMASAIRDNRESILASNKIDMKNGLANRLADPLMKRLELDDKKIEIMADNLVQVAALPEPIGQIDSMWERPNGLRVGTVRVPIGVIGVIYESRPNVTVEVAALCIKSGNGVLLRGGSEAISSNTVIAEILQKSAKGFGLDQAIQFVNITDRQAVQSMIAKHELIDLIVPRGSNEFIRYIMKNSEIPVVGHADGVCHVFIDQNADLEMATEIAINSKTQYVAACNAMETLLIHQRVAQTFLPRIQVRLAQEGVELRGCQTSQSICPDMLAANSEDWSTEYLDKILSIRIVDDFDQAVDHINKYGSHHSDAIITNDYATAQKFLKVVDSAAVYVNSSTRFTDGYEFGLGAEVGISTQKLHCRGPMGLEGLTSYKYVIYGDGQIRQ
ncbi:MAG: glutamate-5-semialdehyde dehydrogenase [Candidatus Poribacteria bacterium]|nr:glutamate-5-semialdehyde dehydrogenase [Candidatus Poribacteria bacterium]